MLYTIGKLSSSASGVWKSGCTLIGSALLMENLCHWKFVVHDKNYSPDCTAGEDEGKSAYFQCEVHLRYLWLWS